MSLFWKVFGWFWVSQYTLFGATTAYFIFIDSFSSEPHETPRSFGEFLLRQMPVLILVGLVVSYILARYLASPAEKLRKATHQLAEGDLSTRISPQMGRRRDELADMGRDFDMMAERIETLVASERRLVESERRTVEAQQRLIADISHELRSPLARIAYALDLAKDGADESTSRYLSRIAQESGRLNELIGQLLTLARLDATSGETVLESIAPLNFSILVREVCQDADFEAEAHSKRVFCEGEEAGDVRGSADLLRSAIENVVRNAVRHTPEKTVVEVDLKKQGRFVHLIVRDHGSGVPEEELEALFRPFYRVGQARERESGGVGLGLSITERAVRFHGGKIQARNATGGGLEVEIELPLA